MQLRDEECRDCGQPFSFEVKRGRPPKSCLACREARSNGVLDDRLVALGRPPTATQRFVREVAQEVLFSDSSEGLLSEADIKELLEKVNKTPKQRSSEENTTLTGERLVDHLDFMLRSRGTHIQQNRGDWD